jgi:hypothetical protein
MQPRRLGDGIEPPILQTLANLLKSQHGFVLLPRAYHVAFSAAQETFLNLECQGKRRRWEKTTRNRKKN